MNKMISNKFLYTLVGILMAILAMCKLDFGTIFGSSSVIEPFWNGIQFTTRNQYSTTNAQGNNVALPLNYLNPATYGNEKFVSTPQFQAILSPRMSNTQYGANIRYNMPDRANMAVPCDPLTFGSMAQENYLSSRSGYKGGAKQERYNSGQHRQDRQEGHQRQEGQDRQEGYRPEGRENYECANCGTGQCGGGCSVSCGKGGYGFGHDVGSDLGVTPDYHTGNWQQVQDTLSSASVDSSGAMPIGTMNSLNAAGEPEQTVVLSHIMPANVQAGSRLYAQSDFFRGDLFINPDVNPSQWFKVNPVLSRDLNAGALQVMGGNGNESNLQTISAIAASSGQTALGGIDISTLPKYKPNMAVQHSLQQSANTDVQVTAFP